MDTYNYFFTPATALHARLEYALGFVVSTLLLFLHWEDLSFWTAVLLFAYIDLFGTLPGMWAYRRSTDGQIPKAYFVVYNVMHSAITQGLVTIGYLAVFGFEWALLAIPAHLCADRSVFNNYPKPFGLAFEPVLHPAFQKFREDYRNYRAVAMDWKRLHASRESIIHH